MPETAAALHTSLIARAHLSLLLDVAARCVTLRRRSLPKLSRGTVPFGGRVLCPPSPRVHPGARAISKKSELTLLPTPRRHHASCSYNSFTTSNETHDHAPMDRQFAGHGTPTPSPCISGPSRHQVVEVDRITHELHCCEHWHGDVHG